MIKKITNNIGLKILSLFFAIALWLIVVNVDDPEVTRSFTVPVTIENAEVLADNGKVYEVLDESDSVRIVVTAKRSIIENLSASDFQAVADMQDLDVENLDGTQKIAIDVSALRYSSQLSMNARVHYLEISVEDEAVKRVVVEGEVWGTPSDGYAVGEMTISPNVIEISGPSSIVETIETAKISVDVSGMTESLKQTATPVYYDAEGNVIDISRLTPDADEVVVHVECLSTKTVPITYDVTGTPADNYSVDTITGSLENVVVKGTKETLEHLDIIAVSDLDVDGISADKEIEILLENYLPDGVSLYTDGQNQVTVTVTVKVAEEKVFTINTSDIIVEGLDSSYTVEFSDSTLQITLSGMAEVLEELTADDIIAKIDVTDCAAGTYTTALDITAPDHTTVAGTVYATVVISHQADTGENEE